MGKYKFASPVPKRNPFCAVKGLNKDIKDFKDQLIFSIVLKRERNPRHTQVHISFATELKSILPSVNFSW